MIDPPGYYEPRARRTLSEWLYDLIIPPSPYEAEYRALLMEQAKRTALRTAVQAERIEARKRRAEERESLEREARERRVAVGVWKLSFFHNGKAATLFSELTETRTHRSVQPVRLVYTKEGAVLPCASRNSAWEFAKTQTDYVRYIRAWLDDLVGEHELSKVKGMTLAARSKKGDEK